MVLEPSHIQTLRGVIFHRRQAKNMAACFFRVRLQLRDRHAIEAERGRAPSSSCESNYVKTHPNLYSGAGSRDPAAGIRRLGEDARRNLEADTGGAANHLPIRSLSTLSTKAKLCAHILCKENLFVRSVLGQQSGNFTLPAVLTFSPAVH